MSETPSDLPAPLLPEEPERARVPWRVADLFLSLGAGMLLSIVLLLPVAIVVFDEAQSQPSFAAIGGMGILIYLALAISAWFFALKRRGVSLREAGFRPVPFTTLLKMVPVTIGMMVLTAIVVAISAQVFGDVPTAQDQVVGDAQSISFQDFIWLFILGAVAAPIVEEFMFRGLLYPLLRNRLTVAIAVAMSALLFAFLHFIPPLVPALLVMGVVLAVLVERYESLYPSILVHSLNNGAALLALYAAIGR